MTCIQKWILYNSLWWSVQWLDREEAPKYFPKPNLHQKKVTATVWWSADVLSRCSFLNPGETITSEKYAQQIDDMLQMPAAGLGQWKGPTLHDSAHCMLHNQGFKSWVTWVMKFCLIHHIHLTSCQLTTTSSSILTTFFAGKTLPQPAGGRTCFPRIHQIPKHGFSRYRKKQIYFLLAKKCVDLMVPSLVIMI